MKKMKRFFGALAAAAMVLSLMITMDLPVQAKPAPYGYKIRVFAGNQGAFTDGSTMKEFEPGESFDPASIAVKPATTEEDGTEYEKYYVKGIKPSGSDLSENLGNTSFVDVKSDMDYVVVYGVRGAMTSYTVEYLDANGNALAQSRTYEGNIGDKPIVPYLYIEGYTPQAYSLTMTLRSAEERPEGNVFTFRYTPVPVVGGGNRTVYDEEVVTTTNTTTEIVPAEGAEADAAGGGVAVIPGEGGDAQGEAGAAGEAGEAAGGEETPAEPQELIDLDDEEVPLANIPGSNGGIFGIGEPGAFFVNMPPAVLVGVVSLAVLAVAAAWYLLFMRKKGTNKGNEEK